MKMNVNWKRFLLAFTVLQVMVLCAGCTAAWLGAVSGMLPALETVASAIISFVMALEGKTVPASVSQAIQKIGGDISQEIAQVQQLIAEYKSAASTGLLSQIQAVLQGIVTNLSQILSAANVSDQATVSKLTQMVGLAVAAAQAIIGLIPIVIAKLDSGASASQLEAEDREAAVHVENADKSLKEAYKVIVTTPTTNAEVNAALEQLPQSL